MRTTLMIAATISIVGCSHPMSRYSHVPPLPTPLEAASAYVSYEENACRALVDVCDGIPAVRAEAVEGLLCHRAAKGTAVCTFQYAGRRCQARFVMAERPSNSWLVAFRNRVPKGSDIDCANAP